jgi:hypothetical protein
MMAGGACASFMKGKPQPTYPLIVNNRSDFEVVVYAIQSEGSNGMRLGNAQTFSTTTMKVPRNALQASQTLVLRLHSIGSVKTCTGISARCNRAPTFVTGPTPVENGIVVHLDIRADHNGGLSASSVYSDVVADRDSGVVSKPPPGRTP